MSAATPSSPFLALPRELRDEIFAHLARPEHVFSSNPKAEDQSFHRSTKIRETYIDSRIYLPVRPSANVLQSCKQLREECLDYFAHRYIALVSKTNTGASPLGDAASKTVAENSSSEYERRVERSIDDGLVRITLVLMRSVQSTMGSFFPERKELSPRFLAMKPLLGRVSKIKLLVWAGYEWWRAARPRDMGAVRIRKAQFKRTSADHDDEVQQSTQWEGGSTETPKSEPQNKLSIAVATILQHLPNIEELEIDVRIHAAEYWNWDLPDDRWEYLSGWLQSPLHFEDQCRLKKVKRNLICQWEPPHSFMFFRQIEARPEGGKSWHFERGYRSVPMDLEEQNSYPAEPPLTESFDRSK